MSMLNTVPVLQQVPRRPEAGSGGQREAGESASARVERQDRERRLRLRDACEKQARARLDAALAAVGLTVVLDATGMDKGSVNSMRRGDRPVPAWLLLAVEEMATAPHAQLVSEGVPVGTAAAVSLARMVLEMFGQVGACLAGLPSLVWRAARRRAPVIGAGLLLSCNDPRIEAARRALAPVAQYASEHPVDAVQIAGTYAVQAKTTPPPRRYFCDGDLIYQEPVPGQPFGCGERGGHFACSSGDCDVHALGPGAAGITEQGAAGWWSLAPRTRYLATWRAL